MGHLIMLNVPDHYSVPELVAHQLVQLDDSKNHNEINRIAGE